MKKKILIILIIIICISGSVLYLFIKNNYKVAEFGNTTIKSLGNGKEYILNMQSYEADVSIEVSSNKNKTNYRLKQKFIQPNIFKQEVVEPTSIKGLITIYDGNTLKIENSSLNLSKIYENYPYVAENSLCLYDFIQHYKQDPNAKQEEKEGEIILKTKRENQYQTYQTLYLDKNTGKPLKMQIEDKNQKMLVYILYNEIKINSVKKEEVLAFKLKSIFENI